MDNPIFRNTPYSRRECWIWLIEHAEWEDGAQINVQGAIITLKRGQLSHSVRYLAEAWNLDKTKVHRTLKLFEKSGMIESVKSETSSETLKTTKCKKKNGKSETQTGTPKRKPQTIISICNYSQYQDGLEHRGTINETSSETSSETSTETSTETSGETKIKNLRTKEDKEKKGGEDAPPRQDYVFEGRVIKLVKKDYDEWKRLFPNVPDFDLELWYADAYYSQHPPPKGKWFFAVMKWLKKEHQAHTRPETEEEKRLRQMYERAGF